MEAVSSYKPTEYSAKFLHAEWLMQVRGGRLEKNAQKMNFNL
jgi:hypothetical protein